MASRQSNFIDQLTNIEFEYVTKYDDYYIYKLTLQANFTEQQLNRANELIEKFLQESFETPDRSYAFAILYCGTTTFASFHRDATLTLEHISGLLLARVEAYDNSYYICFLSVLQQHRQRGVGTKLLQVMINEAMERKSSRVTLHVNSENRGAISLYERCGMRCVDFLPNFYIGDDLFATQDAFAMVLQTNNVKNATAVCQSTTAVQISPEEESVYRLRCPHAFAG